MCGAYPRGENEFTLYADDSKALKNQFKQGQDKTSTMDIDRAKGRGFDFQSMSMARQGGELMPSGKACNDFNGAVIEDLNEIKATMEELRNMLLVVGNCDERFRQGFIKYFPKYFKAAPNE